jgi:hypothetical protein
MVDELFDRAYRANRNELNAALTTGFTKIGHQTMAAFEALNRANWSAPWHSLEQAKCK